MKNYTSINKLFLLPVLAALVFLSSCGGGKNIIVQIETNLGNMKVKLYNETPAHRDTFVSLIQKGYYDDLLFHRAIKEFVVQGGDPTSKTVVPEQELGNGGKDFQFPAEIDKNPNIHKKGAIAFANTMVVDSLKHTVGGQFYIVQGKPIRNGEITGIQKLFGRKYTDEQKEAYGSIGGLPHLDTKNTVFGEVIKGTEVIDAMTGKETNENDRPLQDIRMKVVILKGVK